MILRTIFFILFFSVPSFENGVYAKNLVRVGLEVAKPLVDGEGNGIIEKVLKEVERKSQLVFEINYMT